MNKQALLMAYTIRRLAKTGIKPAPAPVEEELFADEPADEGLDSLGPVQGEPEAQAEPDRASRIASIIKRLKS